ncbi:OmpA family protein [Ekhidna sp.]|uniref:OmpA family protein n=1 Tax=Ekhidna sp. TaxID=2608089 RepID=UPI003BA8685E
MKKILPAIVLSLLCFTVFSQSVPRLLKMADDRFQNDRYFEAIEFYEKVVGLDENNQLAKFRLAECFNRTLQYEKAKSTFLVLSNTPDHDYRARSLYSYANLLKQESKFEEADSIYFFLISVPDAEPYLVELSRKQREGCQLALRQKKTDKGFTVNFMDEINSKFHDFGAVINPSNDHLVMVSTRNSSGTQYEGLQYEGLLPDLMAFESRGNNRWRVNSSEQRFSSLNTKWSEGSGSFTKDGQTFYFSSCGGQNGASCSIMVSYLEDGRWTDPVALNAYINEVGSENIHPSISATGDTLFFVSNRSGGVGGNDIWISLKGLEKESWTPAINMGAVINTPENEITPYYSSAFQCLLFASDGHIGYGGYDSYAAKGESFFEPEIYNLGDPFNSTWDDTYFNISDTVGFMASNRVDHEILNLYSFPVSNERLFLSLLISGESLIDARLASKFRDVTSLDLVTFRVEDYAGYDLFEPIKPSKGKPKILEDELSQTESTEVPFERLFFSYGSSFLRPEGKVALEELAMQVAGKSIGSIDILAFTDSIGPIKANIKLSEDRGAATREYLTSLGVDPTIVNVLPRGELPSEGNNDHWFKRILKRRVEIIVKANEPISFEKATPFIVRKTSKLSDIANAIGVSIQEIKEWNGDINSIISAGETIRLKEDKIKDSPIQLLVSEADFMLFITDDDS